MKLRDYQASFDLLLRDTEVLLEYVEPTDQNGSTYSHRLYGLLLRACTDFESLAKDLLLAGNYPKSPTDMNISDYKTLETQLRVDPVVVDFQLWQPKPLRVLPFKGWSVGKPPLPWYDAYNNVKHNRQAEFARANLKVFLEALAGQFVLIARVSKYHWGDTCWAGTLGGGTLEFGREPFRMQWKEKDSPWP